MNTTKSIRKTALENCQSSSWMMEESLNRLETQIKSELSLMHKANLIRVNPELFKDVLDSITQSNKTICKLRNIYK
jgi:vacuolar-type H+-ATPase subunit E/Vma4